MARHSLMQKLEQFRNLGHVHESTYTFRPCPDLQEVVNRFPPGTCLYFDLGESGDTGISTIPDTEPGYRIWLGRCRLYLSRGNQVYENKTGIDLASHMHLLFMSRRFYYVEEADILGYWENLDDEFNRSEDYAQKKLTARSVFLQGLIEKHCLGVASALEIGCNLGRNLNHLKTRMNLNVAGIEISPKALEQRAKFYPVLDDSTFYCGDAREILPTIDENGYDLIFSMAVLMHLHPATPDAFWQEIVRVAGRYIITIENESSSWVRNWARDYRGAFESLGAGQVHEESVQVDEDTGDYIARVFHTKG